MFSKEKELGRSQTTLPGIRATHILRRAYSKQDTVLNKPSRRSSGAYDFIGEKRE